MAGELWHSLSKFQTTDRGGGMPPDFIFIGDHWFETERSKWRSNTTVVAVKKRKEDEIFAQ